MKTPTSAKSRSDFDSHKTKGTPPTESEQSTKEQVRQETRSELVEKFKGFLQKGSYRVKAPEIAEKIVQKISENKQGL